MSLEVLREKIREIEGAPAVQPELWRTGLPAIDTLIGGLPRPGIVELHGAPGSGRTTLALALAARLTREAQLVAWVDVDRSFYPPVASELRVVLSRLLLVRPPPDRALWTTEQLLRGGCFPLVVVSGSLRLGRAGHRWTHAAEAGGVTGLVLSDEPNRAVPASVRLCATSGELMVVRNRGGRIGQCQGLPALDERTDPWQ